MQSCIAVYLSHADVADFTECCIVSLAAVGYAECRRPDGKRERSDALSVRIRDNPWEITKNVGYPYA